MNTKVFFNAIASSLSDEELAFIRNLLYEESNKRDLEKIPNLPALTKEEKQLALNGDKIKAIKSLQDRTGLGLHLAKLAVEHFLKNQ